MRIVIFGLSLSSSWGNGHATTYRSLIRGLAEWGHRVTFFERDVPWYACNRDANRFDYCRLILYDSLRDIDREHAGEVAAADAVIVGSYVPEAIDLVDKLDGLARGALCFYDVDTPVTLEALDQESCDYLRADQLPRFDVYFSFSGGGALDELSARGARRPKALYCSVDTKLYRPLEDVRRTGQPRWKLGYMGTYAEDRQPTVEKLILEVARRRPRERFVIAGPGYPGTDEWPGNVDWIPHIGPDEHRLFYSRQRFTLNATRAAMVELGYSPSVRLFEAAACGSCIISDRWRGLEEVLSPDSEVLTAAITETVIDYLDHMTKNDAEAFGAAARRRVVEDHSHVRRAEYMVRCLRETMGQERAAT